MKAMLDTIQCGDSSDLLKQLPTDFADMVITSPPYYKQRNYNDSGLGIGHERTPEFYLEALLETLAECVRIVKPTGNIVYNIGDKYQKGSLLLLPFRFAIMACERFQLQLINEITWIKTNPTPRQFDRRLVSSTEPFFHFAKCNEYYYDRDNFCKTEKKSERSNPTPKLGYKYRELVDQSEVLTVAQKQLAHCELDEVIAEVHSHKIHSFRMKIRGVHAEAFGGQEGGRKGQMDKKGFTIIRLRGTKMKRDIIQSNVETLPGNGHSAIFPLGIIKEMIRLLCPPGGTVVDPYIGSGTTAVAAIHENKHYFGIDIDPSYCVSAEERINEYIRQREYAAA